jgi:hypothetical protein
MSSRIKILLWLYAAGVLVMLPIQLDLRLANCIEPDDCHFSIIKTLAWPLTWPLSWGVVTAGLTPQGMLISAMLLIILFLVGAALDRAASVVDIKRRVKILLALYAVGFLVTLPYQVGIWLASCASPGACYVGLVKGTVWSLLWPLNWGSVTSELFHQRTIVGIALIFAVLILFAEEFHRAIALWAANRAAHLETDESRSVSPSELAIAGLALIALLAAEWTLTSISPGTNYGNGDGKLFQSIVLAALKFGGHFQVTSINPLQGVGSQLLPLNAWANPAYWPFAIFNTQFAPDISGVMALACFSVACYVMARCFDLPTLPSIISAQLSVVLFAPAVIVFGFASVFYINPGWAVVCAPHLLALGILSRLEPGRTLKFFLATSGIFLLLLFSLYCDPLWTMISGISLAVPFTVVALSPLTVRGILVRCATLGCCIALLFFSGVLEYEYTLSKYMARVQFSELLSRPPSLSLASFLFSQPVAVLYYGICWLGWFPGVLLLRARRRVLVVASVVSFAFLFAYTAAFLLLPGNWWLPLPIYVEHGLFPLFTTAAIAGLWCGLRAVVSSPALVFKKREPNGTLAERKYLAPRLSPVYRLFDRLRSGPRSKSSGKGVLVALLGIVIIPAASLLIANRAHLTAEAMYQPWPSEPELGQFFADNIGLDVGQKFHGSITFWATGEDDALSMNSLWMRSIPTANEYSQLVTLQALYLNSALFKKDVSQDLNRFSPWISSGGSYEVLFKTLQALGVRYIVGHDPFPAADERHFSSSKLPRRSTLGERGDWQIYELADPNLGNYSPTEIIQKEAAAEIVATLGTSTFDFRRQAVLGTATKPLVPARDVQLTLIRGGLHVSGRSDGTSLVLLPQQFSHCLRAHTAGVTLVRANLIMTGIIFSGGIDTDITFDYGIFSPGCRRADLKDMDRLGLVTAFFNQPKASD